MKALVGAFNQEKALVGAFSVIVQPAVEPMDRFTALPRTLGPSTGRSISWTTARTQATLRMSLMMMMKMTALVPPRRKRMMIQQQVRAFAICNWIFAWHIVQWNGPSTVYSLHKMIWPNPMDHFHYSSCANICALFSLYGWFIGIGRSQWLIELSRSLIYQLHHSLNL